MPEHQQPCVLQFITCFDDASQWITLNCFRHNSPIELPTWRVFDDYVSYPSADERYNLYPVGYGQATLGLL